MHLEIEAPSIWSRTVFAYQHSPSNYSTPIFLDQHRRIYMHCGIPIFDWSVTTCPYALWNCGTHCFLSTRIDSFTFTVELRYPIFSFYQHRLVYVYRGTAAVPILSRSVSTRLYAFSFFRSVQVYMYRGTVVFPIFSRSMSTRLYAPWNCNCSYFPLINTRSFICSVELKHPIFCLVHFRHVLIYRIYPDECRLVYLHYGTVASHILSGSLSTRL